MKKKKILVRIVAICLAIITLATIAIPLVNTVHVHAAAINDSSSLPSGFEAKRYGGEWEVVKKENNTAPAIMLDGLPDSFDTAIVAVFVANLETQEVEVYELYAATNYIASLKLQDGYYAIYANGLAWSDKDGGAFAINSGNCSYMYVGDAFDSNKFSADFFRNHEKLLHLNVGSVPEGYQVVPYNSVTQYTEEMLSFSSDLLPKESLPEVPEDVTPSETAPITTEPPVIEQDPQESVAVPEPPVVEKSFWEELVEALLRIFSESFVVLIVILLCGVGLLIIRYRKQKKLSQQAELDSYDDQSIN